MQTREIILMHHKTSSDDTTMLYAMFYHSITAITVFHNAWFSRPEPPHQRPLPPATALRLPRHARCLSLPLPLITE
ncbi:hypothetical protein E2C01_021990 [Portunus trituberculatus]|uniref:Uncharacterized protein n=1 Tax=Portunus trituberculatus TaxID=210409 RepID=A0A5B7E5U7_PORTR|nr:hypothetical protein [Portunus trituberculatus]